MQLITKTGSENAANAVIRLNPLDDVLIARQPIPKGLILESEGLTALDAIPSGHKIATRDLQAGQALRRYGQIIGFASQPIKAGEHVHVHNLAMGDFSRDYAFGVDARGIHTPDQDTFMGIVRADGRVATRNYVGILTSVNCSATVAKAIADHFRRDINPQALIDYPNVDGVVALTHSFGCAVDPGGEALAMLRRTLGGYAIHPNFASVLMIGLGCETNQIADLLEAQGLEKGEFLRAFTIQGTGGTSKTIASGIEQVKSLLAEANRVEREPVSAKHLIINLYLYFRLFEIGINL